MRTKRTQIGVTMNFRLDTHTHTIASGHAYSTLSEMVTAAKNKGLSLLSITEHAPALPGSCHIFYFNNYRVVPRNIDGVELFLGAEANILDTNGKIDLDLSVVSTLDFIIASLHTPCFNPSTIEDHTSAVINAIKNPLINIIGHPDDRRFPLDYELVVKTAREYNVLIELNNSSLNPGGFRENAREIDIAILNLCKKHGTSISLGSDAHISYDVGNFSFAEELLTITEFPEELIVNTSVDKFKTFINKKRDLLMNTL